MSLKLYEINIENKRHFALAETEGEIEQLRDAIIRVYQNRGKVFPPCQMTWKEIVPVKHSDIIKAVEAQLS